jgi:hypothetical protein
MVSLTSIVKGKLSQASLVAFVSLFCYCRSLSVVGSDAPVGDTYSFLILDYRASQRFPDFATQRKVCCGRNQPWSSKMNNLCFYSLLASNQEVDFFTDILFDTDLAGEVMSDNSLVTELESIPQEAVLDEEAEAIVEQWDIEVAIEVEESVQNLDLPEGMLTYELHYTCDIKNEIFNIAQQVARGIEY